ncbi:MAG TPA: nuclear transport factor 2 family protein [Candidatus Dormibacteraeota bacterium]|nr:nuclear transport factor 2 family protein [Candidatus Dormibacteraeota bacterium]
MNTTTTRTDPKIESVQRLYAAYGRGDIDGVLAEVSDDVDWAAGAASASAPWYGSHRGRDGVARFFGAIASSVDVTQFELVSFAANETDVMNVVRFGYTVRATGRSVAMTMQHWWRFDGGRIVLFRGAEDSEQSAAAFA